MTPHDFSRYLRSCENQTSIIEDTQINRKFKLIGNTRVYYKKMYKDFNEEVETILDLEDALMLYSLYR